MSLEAAHRSINWTTVILVGAMMPLSLAMERTGAAQLLAEGLVAAVGPLGPTALLAGLFVLTATLGQIMSNTATTLIVIPVALAAAARHGRVAAAGDDEPVRGGRGVLHDARGHLHQPDGDGSRRLQRSATIGASACR